MRISVHNLKEHKYVIMALDVDSTIMTLCMVCYDFRTDFFWYYPKR